MKRIIKGKLYDTDTAKLIYKQQDNEFTKALYQKQTGHYFILYEINSGIPEIKPTITPVSYEQASLFAKKFMPKETYDFHFGSSSAEDKIISTTIRMSEKMHRILKQLAVENNCTSSEFVTRLINDYLTEHYT